MVHLLHVIKLVQYLMVHIFAYYINKRSNNLDDIIWKLRRYTERCIQARVHDGGHEGNQTVWLYTKSQICVYNHALDIELFWWCTQFLASEPKLKIFLSILTDSSTFVWGNIMIPYNHHLLSPYWYIVFSLRT